MLTVDFARLGVRPGERVLDLGCGAGRHAFEVLRRGAHVVALDTDAAELARVSAMFAAMSEAGEVPDTGSAATARGDATAMPFPDGCFDKVIAAEVLEHIPADQAAMDEIARVLRPGGVFAGLWNVDDDRVGWVAGLAEMVDSPRLSSWHSEPDADSESEILRTGSSWFAPVQEREFPADGQARTAASLVETIATHSKFLVMAEPERSHALGRVRDYLSRQPETSNGEFTLPLVTVAVRAVSR